MEAESVKPLRKSAKANLKFKFKLKIILSGK